MTDEFRTANENTTGWNKADPDFPYVREYMQKMFAHFQDCKIKPLVVSAVLMETFFRYLPGDPYAKLPDEGDLQIGLSSLNPMVSDLDLRVKAYWKAIDRVNKHRIEKLAAELNVSIEEAGDIWVERNFGAPFEEAPS